MVRTNIYVDQADLDQIKAVSRHRNVSEAEIIREGIRLAVMSNRLWPEPLDWPIFEGGGEPVTRSDVSRAVVARADR